MFVFCKVTDRLHSTSIASSSTERWSTTASKLFKTTKGLRRLYIYSLNRVNHYAYFCLRMKFDIFCDEL